MIEHVHHFDYLQTTEEQWDKVILMNDSLNVIFTCTCIFFIHHTFYMYNRSDVIFFFQIFDTNVKAAFFLCKEVIPFMEKRG